MVEPTTLRQFVNQRTPKGRWVSVHPDHLMDHEDLVAHDDMLDELELLPELDDEDDAFHEDPDSDGFGWERKALRGAYA